MSVEERGYFRSRIFRRLFFSYALIILVFVTGYCSWYLYSYRSNARVVEREICVQKANAFCTSIDRRLLNAQGICNAMNSSESIRNLYQQKYIERKNVDSMLLYRVLSELTRIKASSGSVEVYTVMLGFSGDSRLYTPGTVIALEEPFSLPQRAPWVGVTSAAALLGIQGSTNITLNKEYLIYADAYSGSVGASDKGVMLVLIDLSALGGSRDQLRPSFDGLALCRYSEALFSNGVMDGTGEIIEVESLLGDGLTYRLHLTAAALSAPLSAGALAPVAAMALLGAVLLVFFYFFSRRRYQPIGLLSQMVGQEENSPAPGDEMAGIIQGITDLIGERNGYRERMITISPYANQGALHQLLNGSVRKAQLEVLREEQFWELRRARYAVAIVDIAVTGEGGAAEQRCLDARALAAHACTALSGEELTVVCSARDARTLYAVVNSDEPGDLDGVFYTMLERVTEAIDDPAVSVTIGVSAPRTELEQLRGACDEAERALEHMLTGGRGSVYFVDGDEDAAKRDYVFPKDAQKRIERDLLEGDPDDLNALLDELWEANIRRAALTPEAVRQLVDALHGCIGSALRNISEKSTTRIRVERVREPATIEEIFDYYRTVLAEALRACQNEVVNDRGGEALEKEICDYINANLTNPELSLSAVADHFGVSGKLVGMVCKNQFGKTYLQYVRDCQIQRAAQLLQTTDLPLEEIASQCGFTNLLTFRRNFKAVMNMNPSDFRK